jgi:hypothetical protein
VPVSFCWHKRCSWSKEYKEYKEYEEYEEFKETAAAGPHLPAPEFWLLSLNSLDSFFL